MDEFNLDKEFEEFKKRINRELEKEEGNLNNENINDLNNNEIIEENLDSNPEENLDLNLEEIKNETEEIFYYENNDSKIESNNLDDYTFINNEDSEIETNNLDDYTFINNEDSKIGLEIEDNQNNQIEEFPVENIYSLNVQPKNIEEKSFYSETIQNKSEKEKSGKFKKSIALMLVASLVGGPLIGGSYALTKNYLQKNNSETLENSEENFSFNTITDETEKNYINNQVITTDRTESIAKVKPSIVCITTTIETAKNSFFSIPDQVGAGSGIIFSKDGENVYIVTNYHVIENATRVGIVVNEADPVEAKLVGKEPNSDLAVISVKLEDLKQVGIEEVEVANFGNSDNLVLGEDVIAIGNALGEGITVTGGMVSAVDKTILVQGKTLEVLQTDAAINPGNSGGALINNNGEVIGINTAKLSQDKVEGTGYSISSNVAKPIIESLMQGGGNAMLGIRGGNITEEMAEMYNFPTLGVFISEIVEGTYAEQSGLLSGDIIISLNGTKIVNMEALQKELRNFKPDEEVELEIIRYDDEGNAKNEKIKVKLTSNENSF